MIFVYVQNNVQLLANVLKKLRWIVGLKLVQLEQ